jgi:hypothetical protein
VYSHSRKIAERFKVGISGCLIALLVPIALFGALNIGFASTAASGNVVFSSPLNLSADSYQAHYPWVEASGSYVYVAWTEEAHGIYFRVSSDGGQTWNPSPPTPSTRLSPTGGTTNYPVIASNGTNVYVAWTQSLTSGGNSEIFVASSNNNGGSFNTEELSINQTSYTSDIPYVAAYGNDVYVIWHSILTSTSAQSVWVSSSTTGGQKWSTAFQLDAKSGQADEPQIAAWGNYVYATWDRNGAWFDVSSNNGANWAAPVNLNSRSGVPSGLVREPWISASGSNVYVSWNDNSGYGTTLGTIYEPYIMVSNNNGLTWNQNYAVKNVKLNLMPTSSSSWEIQSQAIGNTIYVMWRDHTPAYTTNGDLLMTMSTNAGGTWTPTIGTTPTNVSHDNQITGWSNRIGVSGSTVALAYMSDCVTGLQEPSPNSGAGDCGMMVSYSNNGGQSFYPQVNVSQDRTAGPISDVSSSNFAVSGSSVFVAWQDENTVSSTFQVYFSMTNGNVQFDPTMSITPVKGAVGTGVVVSGTSFAPSSSITIQLDGSIVTITTSDSTGAFFAPIVIPAAVAGSHTITATDGKNTLSKTFNVVPDVSLQPVKGAVGKLMTVTGAGFAATSSVQVTYDGVLMTSTTTDSSGSFSATLTVPNSVAGKHTVAATDASSNTASGTSTVVPSISEKPVKALPGTGVTVTGTGFAANSAVTITFNGVQVVTTTTDSTGSFTILYNVPNLPAAKYTVKAIDSVGNSATATFTVS